MASADEYEKFSQRVLSEYKLRQLNFPRISTSPEAANGTVELYGGHFGFDEGCCKRCDKKFDTSYETLSGPCNYHPERSKFYNRKQHPHGCCNKRHGSTGCRNAPQHVHNTNLYLDLTGYKPTEKKDPQADAGPGVYVLDTELVHTKKGLEVGKVTVVDTNLKVVYDEFCLPTSDIIDYNTFWSGISEKHLPMSGTKTFDKLRTELLELFSADTILVGHGVSSDLISLKIIHDKIVDTLDLYPHPRGLPRKRSLKDIALEVLHQSIQVGVGHSSEEDAKTTMRLALKKV